MRVFGASTSKSPCPFCLNCHVQLRFFEYNLEIWLTVRAKEPARNHLLSYGGERRKTLASAKSSILVPKPCSK